MSDEKRVRAFGASKSKSVRLAVLVSMQIAISIPAAYAEDPPPQPSKTSSIGQTVTNPVTGDTTTVSALRVDPAGTATAGNTAFVQTADGYTFLVKTEGEVFYNSDAPPVAFVVASVDGDKAVVTSIQATGSAEFALVQSTIDFNDSFNSSGSEGILTPPVDVAGPNGVKQVIYGKNGSNGRAGALFVPPSSGGDGATGQTNTQTLSGDVNATSNIGWEIGSVGGNGGKGGAAYVTFWNARDGGDGGAGGNVNATQSSSSTIKTTGDANHGIFAYSRSGKAGDGGGAIAAPAGGTGGHSSNGGNVTVNQYGTISTDGQNAHGIYALSVSNNGGNGGDQWGLVGKAGSGGYGGNGGQVNVNTYAGAQILTKQDYSNGIFAQSIGGSGGSAGTSGNLLVSLIGQADNGGNGGAVTVSNGGAIQTTGVASRGIMAQSIGGGGGAGGTAAGLVALAMGGVGSNGGSGGAVSVTSTASGVIHTIGNLADGIMAQSIGGSGGQGADAYGLVSIGGNGSKGGSSSTVSVTNNGRIDTEGDGARGIIAQSIGGGGGDGGSSGGMVAVGGSGNGGGAGSTVSVTNDGLITTKGDDAMGILAQSIGGGGGNGGSSGSVGLFAGVGIGGKGGAGGAGGNVNVTLSDTDASQPSLIMTSGDRSTGVFIQSIGGGGGNGGGAVSVAVGAFGAASVSVGGAGGSGGAGGTAILTGSGNAAVQTAGADAAGILLQSIGGGGGNGGYAISAAASSGPVSGSLAVGVGGSGGSGGAGGEVRVGKVDGSGNLISSGFSGSVVTTGERSAGMIFQSVGGGGGNGGLAVAATGSGSLIFSGSVSVGVGGSGGNGGNGGLVRVYTDADITTRGNSSSALLAQSIGGGGGNGGGSIAAGVAASGGGAGTISAGVGGSGSGGGTGGTVNLIAGGDLIRTTGQFSTAIVAQSVGGGGGNGGYTIAAGAAGAGAGAGAVNVGVGGSAAGGGAGGAVNAQVDAVVVTENDDSGAILIQSIGGGGGNGGFSIAAGAAGAGAGAGSVSVGLGGSAGAGGAGGTVAAQINKNVGTQGNRAAGVVAQSIGGGGGNGGFSVSGSVSGAGAGSGSVSVGLGGSGGSGGDGFTVTATVDGNVTTEGDDSTAILAQSIGGGGGNGGFNISGAISGSGIGSGAVSVGLGGEGGAGAIGGAVTLTSNGYIWTQGDRSSGFVAQSIGGGGGNGGFNVSGSIAGSGTGAGTVSVGLGGSGAGGGNGGSVTATSNGTILTEGFASSGFVAQSIGGGGGNGGFNVSAGVSAAGVGAGSVSVGLGGSGSGGGDGSIVIAKTNANIETRGAASTGVLAQSVGGGGGNGGFNITPSLSGAGTGSGAISVGLGGSGAGGGNGGKVDLTVKNDVLTRGAQSSAVVAQSIGGGGGNGGFNVTAAGSGAGTGSGAVSVGLGGSSGAGGTGGQVDSHVTGNLATLGDQSTGLLVQSLGGGGGNGGMNISATVAVAGTGSGGAAVGLGGSGGSGGASGAATSVLTGDVITEGDSSSAVVVQSLGGGGGNGGMNVSGTVTVAGTGSGGVSVGIGGSGGDGGNAGAADSTIDGNVQTSGDDASGVVVQSAGGGGGNGAINISGVVSVSGNGSGAASVGIGGTGGSGGTGAAASNNMTGDVFTKGDRSGGVIVQSLGGGGGNGGINVTGAVSLAAQNSGAVGLGIGGFGGSGGSASTASNDLTGNVTTQGADATGVLVQSVGGGGGNGGINVSGALSISGNGSGVAAVGVGGFGGDGGFAGDVTGKYDGIVVTSGDRSSGIVAQSLGGGGGNGGINISGGLSVAPQFSGALGFGIGGFGGSGGIAGSVDQTVIGYVETRGVGSIGILSQSLGGGGGNGGLNVSGAVSLSRQTSAAVALGVGGFGGSGADAGALTASDVTGGVLTFGDRSSAIVTQSLGGGGGNGGMTVAGTLNLSQQNGGAASLGLGGFGGGGGNGGNVTSKVRVTNTSDNITTIGDESIAVMAQSVGGGGGTGGTNVAGAVSLTGQSGAAVALGVGGFGGAGGNAGSVGLDVIGTVNTFGDRSTGLLAQSLGGGGGVGGTNISGSLALTKPSGSSTIFSISAGVGGYGGGGGDAGAVDLSYTGLLTTLPRTINSDGSVTFNETQGADGVVAQSIGGGGGQGGLNVSGGVAISGKPGEGQPDASKSYGVLIGVGGFGGTGGNASTVDVNIGAGSTILSHGSGRSGILAQSVGGGGGNGGMNVSGGIVSDTSLIVGIGGMGGKAGSADDVKVTARADIRVTTDPADFGEPSDQSFETKLRSVVGNSIVDTTEGLVGSFGLKSLFVDLGLFKSDETLPDTKGSAGLLAQSIGGGGGNGGLNVSGGVAISKDGKIPSITFGVGGSGGAGNVSGDVTVDHAGTIEVEGNWKHGILAQSIAGGGGNGALNASGQLNWGSSNSSGGATDLSIVAGLGGDGGTGANAGNVDVTSDGDISTKGYHSRGIFAQSVGGGGGTGGINVTAVATKDSSPVGIGIGGTGSNGGHAGNVSVSRGTALESAGLIITDGSGAHGIEASSIGGGGGDAGINAVLGVSKTTGSGSNSGSEGDRKETVNDGVESSALSGITDKIDTADATTGSGGSGSKKTVNSAVIAVGGSAGNAGNGGEVNVEHFGDIVTLQKDSHGVFAQSIGGGGGNAAFNAGMVFETGDASKNKGFGIAIGGGTGAGGTGGDVAVNNSGIIYTQGDGSHGVFAQSVGGGGGNAGYNMLTAGGEDGNIGITIGRTGGTGGSSGDVKITSDSIVLTQGDRSHGLFAQSIGNGGGNSSSTSVSVTTPKDGDKTGNSFSASIGLEGGQGGTSGNVAVNAEGLIYTLGEESHGIFAQSVGGGGGTGGGATGSAGKATSYSINVGGNGGTGGTSGNVDVTSKARIVTEGASSIGILAQSIGGAGGTAGYAKAGTSILSILKNTVKGTEIGTTTSINIGGTGGDGMASDDVTVANGGVLTTLGDGAHGIMAQSVGGGGGKGGLVENTIVNLRSTIASTSTLSIGGNGGTGAVSGNVSVINTSDIGTEGQKAAGIFAQAVGGGGGDAQHVRNIVAGSDADNSTRNALLIGGSGGSGGAAGKVDVKNATGARIITDGDESHGIFAQSIGGGGGNGGEVLSVTVTKPSSTANSEQGLQLGIGGSGSDGGTGGAVDVVNDGLIVTRGDKAHGILAQSIGGGGGNGGYSITGSLALQKGAETNPSMALNIGGSGGSGNAAGIVIVTNTGEINVSGSQSYGVFAQSVGGGGGNGGMAVALSLNDLVNQARGQSYSKIAIGGAGGDGADGGDVTVNHSGTIRVSGENSYGIFAQSVGGGGGNAALSISTPAVMAADYIISTALGARAGTKGSAGEVTVNSSGDIIVTGAGSQAIFSQSVNGGGGNVDTFLDFASASEGAAAGAAAASLTSSLSLGGNDVDGNIGATISQSHQGDIVTTSDRSAGILMQSIGGGGGLSTTTMASSIAGDFTLNAMLGAINTDDSSGGDVIASRKGNVSTFGNLSGGGLAQSIGGGGGRMVVSGADRSEGSGQRNAVVTLGADPSMRNNGGTIALTLNGTVSTRGDNASGQIFQSIGAGGGEAYLTGIDHARLTLGARDGSTGDGGDILVDNIGDLSTTGARSHGFVLQSIGGGGGLIGTNLAKTSIELLLSGDNAGSGGAIDFTNQGNLVVTGADSIGILAQSLGGGGGSVDGLFHGSAGGSGQGGSITLDLTGNILSLGERGIAVLAQSEGKDGADTIDVALDGVIIGGSNGQPSNEAMAETAAVMIDGGTANTLALSSDSFLMALSNRIISGSDGSDQITLNGRAVGNIDLGGGVNSMTVTQGASFYAQNEVNLGASGQLRIDGNLYLGGVAYYTPNTALTARMAGSEFAVTQNVSQTTALTGSLSFTNTATYTADVYFRQDTASGGNSDLINVTGNATIAGTVIPVLHQLDRLQPLVLVNAGGVTADNGTTVVGTAVMSYEIGLNGPTGDGSSIDLIPHADFRMIGMNRNQTLTAEHAARVLSGQGSVAMGPMFALIANMQTSGEVLNAIDNLSSQDYATTQVDALQSGYRFARTMADCGYDNFAARMGDSKNCYWMSASTGRLDRDPSFQNRSFETQSSGVYAGVRMPVTEDLYLGIGTGLEDFSLSSGDRFSSEGQRALLGVSLAKYKGPWELYGILNGGTARYDSTRLIDIYGTLPGGDPVIGGTATVKQRISQANFRIGTAYRYQPTDGAVYLRPAVDFDASYLYSGSATESNSAYGLQLDSTDQWVLSATPSLEVGVETAITSSLMMQAYLRGEVSFANKDDVYINATFAGASVSDGTFRNYSQFGDVTGRLDTGLTFYDTAKTTRLTVGYQGQWSEKTVGHTATVSLGLRF
ncbi:sperm-activating peptides family [Ochrobactrum quorumnocens]|uniref:Sperm-activating peptides family n=1 Tax=Ochrobactrum quorumnocens TaxID=271865 RepID=A0A248UAZ5_9HYPH|nr:autotransporter outer membrane beta-barrel domain-containing protein [[Ochrobactrum] quorumnocens]ASV83762.1 sperm-activating peptides family [[Ochrobactrum] quorumnocens]